MIASLGQSSAGQAEESSIVIVHRKLDQHCELLERGTLFSEGRYAWLRIDGVAEDIYSPELGNDDFVAPPAGVPKKLMKLAQKSGFRVKVTSDVNTSEFPRLAARPEHSACPSPVEAIRIIERNRTERRHELQSKLFRPGYDSVIPPEGVTTPESKTDTGNPDSPPQSTPTMGSKVKVHGTVVLSAVVTSNGDVEQVKVIRSMSSELDKKAEQAVTGWKFHPARKNGLPVPVLINIEINFHLY
jgi:protein TonB